MPLRRWLHREASWARAARARRRELEREAATAVAVDEVTTSQPPAPRPLALSELLRFWAVPVTVIVVTGAVSLWGLVAARGTLQAVAASTLAGVVAAVVVIPVQAVMARRAAQMEFRRDGELVRLAVDRVLEEVDAMLAERSEPDDGAPPAP
jgi:hypothetical protein